VVRNTRSSCRYANTNPDRIRIAYDPSREYRILDIAVVEDDPHTNAFLTRAVQHLETTDTVHRVYSLTEAEQLIRNTPAIGMVLCDIGLPDGNGLKLVSTAATLHIPVIVVSSMGDESTVISAIELGANGYLHKNLDTAEIVTAIKQVLDGGSPLSPSIAGHLMRRFRGDGMSAHCNPAPEPTRTVTTTSDKLTRRETQILQMIARGYVMAEVASELDISVHTVSNHNRNIYRKLSVRSRSAAVFKAQKNGMLE